MWVLGLLTYLLTCVVDARADLAEISSEEPQQRDGYDPHAVHGTRSSGSSRVYTETSRGGRWSPASPRPLITTASVCPTAPAEHHYSLPDDT